MFFKKYEIQSPAYLPQKRAKRAEAPTSPSPVQKLAQHVVHFGGDFIDVFELLPYLVGVRGPLIIGLGTVLMRREANRLLQKKMESQRTEYWLQKKRAFVATDNSHVFDRNDTSYSQRHEVAVGPTAASIWFSIIFS